MFKIEKNIPLPPRAGDGAPPKYPFLEMEVGDSFVIPADDPAFRTRQGGGRVHPAQNCFAYYAKRGLKFASRSQPDGSMRVWRTE